MTTCIIIHGGTQQAIRNADDIREGKGTTLHLRTAMTEFLRRNLPPGPQ